MTKMPQLRAKFQHIPNKTTAQTDQQTLIQLLTQHKVAREDQETNCANTVVTVHRRHSSIVSAFNHVEDLTKMVKELITTYTNLQKNIQLRFLYIYSFIIKV